MSDPETVSAQVSSADTKTDKPWLFKAGAPSPNPRGRPRKGETIAEKLARADAKIARKAIRARDKRLELLNQVGQKTFETYLAYSVGLPAQKYIVEQADSPLLAFLTRHAQQLPYVEGESVRLDAQDDTANT